MNKYIESWNILKNSTPTNINCGKLCNKACCNGSDSDGMILFPGEEKLYANEKTDWFKISDTDIKIGDNYTLKLFVCQGNCDRDKRPLSCRIFPLTPYINNDDELDLLYDLRFAYKCPLIYKSDAYKVREEFINDTYEAILAIIDLKNVKEYIWFLSDEYDNLAELMRKI